MKKIALLFPGQGSQYVGMGKKLIERWPAGNSILNNIAEKSTDPLFDICFNGPKKELEDTINSQPAILAINLLYWHWLLEEMDEIKPDYAAGHSLGEYSAIVATGMLDEDQVFKLVRKRAGLMSQAAQENPGSMVAVLGLKTPVIEELLKKINNTVKIANYNSSGQVVISGAAADMRIALKKLEAYNPKRLVPLSVSGAFHSSLMKKAETELAKALQGIKFSDAKYPFISNYFAKPIDSAVGVKEALSKQTTGSVRWQQSIHWLVSHDVDTFIEVGPGRVLKGLLKRSAPAARCFSLDTYENIYDFKQDWKRLSTT